MSPPQAYRHERQWLSGRMTVLVKVAYSINGCIKESDSVTGDISYSCYGHRLRKRDRNEHSVVWERQSFRIPILRRCCSCRDMIFSLLLSFISPYISFANHVRNFLVRWLLVLDRLAMRLSTTAVSTISISLCRGY